MNDNEILLTGFAQLPRGTTLYEQNKVVGVALVIDYKEEVVKDAEFTFVADLTNYYLSSLVKGYNLKQGMLPLYEKIKNNCLMPSQGAVIQALKSAWERYQESDFINRN